jgi:hypothetical protein
MLLFIKNLQDSTITLDVDPACYIRDLRDELEKLGYRRDRRLVYAGKLLQDDMPLTDYKIPPEATLHLYD